MELQFRNWLEYGKEQAAAIAVLYNGKILILKRGPEAPWMPNKWNLPGGAVDPGESPEQAAIREAREEAKIKVINVRHLRTDNKTSYDVHFYIGQATSNEVTTNYENSSFAWVDNDTAGHYIYVPGVRETIFSALNT